VSELATGKLVRTREATGTVTEIERVLASVPSIDRLDAALDAGASGDLTAVRGGLVEIGRGRVTVRGRFEHAVPEGATAALAGDMLVVAARDTLHSWNTRTHAEVAIKIPSRPMHSLVTDGAFAFVFETGLKDLRIVDLQARTVDELRTSIAIDTVGRRGDILAIVGDGVVQCWERRTLRFAVPGVSFALSPDGSLLATGAGSGVVSIYDAHRGVLLEQFQASTTLIRELAFSADGRRLAAQSTATASLWDVPRATEPAAIIAKRASRVPWRLVDGQLVQAASVK
jgi:WD40 domain-containing protein